MTDTSLKENILLLRAAGETYNSIASRLGCAKSTVSFHCSKLKGNSKVSAENQTAVWERVRKEAPAKESRDRDVLVSQSVGIDDRLTEYQRQWMLYLAGLGIRWKEIGSSLDIPHEDVQVWLEVRIGTRRRGGPINNKDAVHRRMWRLKALAVARRGGGCQHCGEENLAVLTFHHADPAEKEFQVCGGQTRSWDRIKSEVDKCDLLCANCHREEHERLREALRMEGSTGACKNYTCVEPTPQSERGRPRLYCSPRCKERREREERRTRSYNRIFAYKGSSCSKCGYATCRSALSFHHRDPSEKEFSISAGWWKPEPLLRQELDKCDLLCSNCHTLEHCTSDVLTSPTPGRVLAC